jgi:hypothetical protein
MQDSGHFQPRCSGKWTIRVVIPITQDTLVRLPSKGYTTQFYVDGAVTLSRGFPTVRGQRNIFQSGLGDGQVNSQWINVVYMGASINL